ncbi:MAG: thiol-disulfide oxidoreductase DCC family protein [Planktomarina sp.]
MPGAKPLGQRIMTDAGLDPADPSTWLVYHRGEHHTELDAMIHLARHMGGIGYLATALAIVPTAWRSRLYTFVATNRIRWFGRADLCEMPPTALRERLITDI